jgi:hypothetical protein
MAAEVAHADALTTPAMGPTLSANPNPMKFDSPLGKIYVTGVVSGLVNVQSNAIDPPDHDAFGDLSNGQVFIQKTDGVFQFYLQAGAYSEDVLSVPYAHVTDARSFPNSTFSYLPQAFVKIVPNSEWSIMAGKLPTLIGAEYGFSFENINVNRGLLWNQEPIVSRGVQVNYAKGPISVSVSLNDGYYSDVYNWISGLITLTASPKDTIAIAAGGNVGTTTPRNNFATPTAQNNSDIFNLMYTHTEGKWVFNPYFQYDYVPTNAKAGILKSTATWGMALLVKYTINPEWSLGFRGEYTAQTGKAGDGSPFLLYGPGSYAYSITATPTWQKGVFFIRTDLSYTWAHSGAANNAFLFGPNGTAKDQFRATGEAGVIF